jgi:hypothetical protein
MKHVGIQVHVHQVVDDAGQDIVASAEDLVVREDRIEDLVIRRSSHTP